MISVCMIVKNEIGCLAKSVSHIKNNLNDIVDDIVIVDTGSTDGTRELIESLGCRLYDFEWCHDFSAARNFSISEAKNDWVLVLDADEYVESVDIDELSNFITERNKNKTGSVMIENMDNEGAVWYSSEVVRLFNKKCFVFKNKIHEEVTGIDCKDAPHVSLHITIKHDGYSERVMNAKDKGRRNIELLKAELELNPNDNYFIGHLGTAYKMNGELEKALEYYEKIVFNEACANESYYTMMVNDYIKVLIKLGQFNVAILCEHLWKYCSHDDSFVHLMGLAYIGAGLHEKAVDCFLQCVNKEGKMVMDKKYSYYKLGEIFEHFHEYEQAKVCFEICGNFEDATNRLENVKKIIFNNSMQVNN